MERYELGRTHLAAHATDAQTPKAQRPTPTAKTLNAHGQKPTENSGELAWPGLAWAIQ